MFGFFRKCKIEFGAKKALEEAGIEQSSYSDYFNFIKSLGFVQALDASKDALTQSLQSLCFAFATLELMKLRCQLHGQSSNVAVINDSLEYLGKAIELQISTSVNPEHSERTAGVLLDTIMHDARNFIAKQSSI
ncbi:hypothetical protein P7M42_14370 [Vibrio parahaemolyticus]|nr:hypothetical protein [Vibrio parahaemolyticus]HCE2311125.1 hypothetical protein [Vibrio parahaemolyticus]HCE4676055.1 hypothetical protein [Vibrio parahaemolyticus]